ncbi:tRNA preQ1(34) S-adenosylmethionine ribosyltransferase-isomerase QueA [Tautonia sociabilis]|uniref:S-adenosylmethionine:tRNA ribosyltransferase-isomerase n=1 Tax=Tautonia sociabilis TaxID=2080755 RepID=A0A432MI84_9BACT|nr:tRNA preQ1(34) S-adenosylmethionine ribosyltransferase-isomerase QueA [Tautonia sociabilis]RUL87071.1 tRNA preQ1(34) S-adenosylmethionine ribosyltransferase-isomerase QueA [Tautonia sociabilis]
MRTDDFDFHLPDELIAQHPADRRDRSRLMVVRRDAGEIEHRCFADLPDLLRSGDVLVRNDSKVVPARLLGRRSATGGRWEGLFLSELPDGSWELMAQTRGRPQAGEIILIAGNGNSDSGGDGGGDGGGGGGDSGGGGLRLELLDRLDSGHWRARPLDPRPAFELLDAFGRVPLPPYIRRVGDADDPEDRERYQTIYASRPGSVAAPTAGLHFTAEVFDRLAALGVATLDVTLHVGPGTFRPIKAERVEDHRMHAEWAAISPAVADRLNAARSSGGRVVAVGTTATRVLETGVTPSGTFLPFTGQTDIYLRPGVPVLGTDALVTNFHLPRSSLLVLVSALAGIDLIRAAYAEAVSHRYRFYSFGDAMLIL